MQTLDIQYALKKAGDSQAEIARRCGVSQVTVSYVVAGKTTSRPIAEAIATATGLPLDTLWPGKYPAGKYPADDTVALAPVTRGDADRRGGVPRRSALAPVTRGDAA